MKSVCSSLPESKGLLFLCLIVGLFFVTSAFPVLADSNGSNSCVEGLYPDCRGVCGGAATLDACGVCNGPGLNNEGCCGNEVRDCEDVCGGTSVELQCGCNVEANSDNCCGDERDYGCGCGVPEGECEKECLFVASHSPVSNWTDDYIDSFGVTRSQDVPLCFYTYFGNKCSQGARGEGTLLYGGCNMNSPKIILSWINLGQFLGVPEDLIYNPYEGFNHIYDKVEWYMDESCKYVANPGNREICGFGGVSQSPISLVFGELSELEHGMTVVSFPLDARKRKQYTLWKASEKFPLLVYDPKKTGQVTSAKQLFGSYTYGGLTKTALDFHEQETRGEWGNGYEALGLLDLDANGIVSGAELDDLSLWYDRNRNAKVDPGELKNLRDEGIQELFYKDPDPVSGRKHLLKSLGFTRLVNGTLEKGASIDWYSDVYSSKNEALLALTSSFEAKEVSTSLSSSTLPSGYMPSLDRKREKPYVSWPHQPLTFTPHVSTDQTRDVSGYWFWHIDSENTEQNPSVFAFEHDENGKLLGFSVVESALENNDAGIRSGVRAVPVKGVVSQNEKGILLRFESRDRKSGAVAISVAYLSKDGRSLQGSTSQKFTGTSQEKEASAYLEYTWKASRVNLQR